MNDNFYTKEYLFEYFAFYILIDKKINLSFRVFYVIVLVRTIQYMKYILNTNNLVQKIKWKNCTLHFFHIKFYCLCSSLNIHYGQFFSMFHLEV